MSEARPTLSGRAQAFASGECPIHNVLPSQREIFSAEDGLNDRALSSIVLDAITSRFVSEVQLDTLASRLGPERFLTPFAQLALDAVEMYTSTWHQLAIPYWEDLKRGPEDLPLTQAAREVASKRHMMLKVEPISTTFPRFVRLAVAAVAEEEQKAKEEGKEIDWSARLWAQRRIVTQSATPDVLSFMERVNEPSKQFDTYRQFITYGPTGEARVNLDQIFAGMEPGVDFDGHGCIMNVSRRALGTQQEGEQPTPMLVAYFGLVSFVGYLAKEHRALASLQAEGITAPSQEAIHQRLAVLE